MYFVIRQVQVGAVMSQPAVIFSIIKYCKPYFDWKKNVLQVDILLNLAFLRIGGLAWISIAVRFRLLMR